MNQTSDLEGCAVGTREPRRNDRGACDASERCGTWVPGLFDDGSVAKRQVGHFARRKHDQTSAAAEMVDCGAQTLSVLADCIRASERIHKQEVVRESRE